MTAPDAISRGPVFAERPTELLVTDAYRFATPLLVVSAALGVLLLAVALLFVRPVDSFGQLAVLVWGLVLCLTGALVGPRANRLALQVVGVASCAYAALDIQEDVIDRPWLEHSDAAELARLTDIPVATWGALWLCVAVACTACLVLLASRAEPPKKPQH